MIAAPDDDGFTSVTHKKPVRPLRNRKGKNRFIERTLDQKLEARHDALRRSGYLDKCRGASHMLSLEPFTEPDRSLGARRNGSPRALTAAGRRPQRRSARALSTADMRRLSRSRQH